jgi:hypothetical protein
VINGTTEALHVSVPFPDGHGWFGEAYEIAPDASNWDIDARAICANVTR